MNTYRTQLKALNHSPTNILEDVSDLHKLTKSQLNFSVTVDIVYKSLDLINVIFQA